MPGRNPLAHLRQLCVQLGRCNLSGRRLKNTPWAFQLAHVVKPDAPPAIRTIGFKRVTDDGIEFQVRRVPENANGFKASIVYLEGTFPPAPGGACEQWRGEGRVVEIPTDGVLATAPAASFSQTLAVAARGVGKRTELADRDAFVSEVRDLKASLEHGNVKEDFVEEAVQVFRFEPSRLELLANGESTDGIWDRFEWTRDADGAWSEPRRLMPY